MKKENIVSDKIEDNIDLKCVNVRVTYFIFEEVGKINKYEKYKIKTPVYHCYSSPIHQNQFLHW